MICTPTLFTHNDSSICLKITPAYAKGKQVKNASAVAAKCLVFCHSPKKEYYKKFLFEPYPVESHLYLNITNHICGEIFAKNITSIDACIDWSTWTFMYRRLS